MAPADSALSSLLRSFRHRNFRLFFCGQLVSLVGTWMQQVAQSWLVYRLTHSSVLLGMTSFIGQIPGFLIAPLGGVVADRYNRHRIVVITQTSAMLLAYILAALTFANAVHIWEVMLLAGLLGIVNAFDIPARQSFVVEMVGREDLSNAIALNSSMVTGSRIVGPAIAGALVAIVGEAWCFLLNGLSYIAVIVGLLLMRLPPHERRHTKDTALANILEGFRFASGNAPIRLLLVLLAVCSLAGMPYVVLMPIFADKVLNSGARGLGILMGMAGGGALLGALALAMKRGLKGLSRWIAAAAAVFGLALIAFSQSKIFWLSTLLLIPVGFAMQIQMSATNTLLQSMVPDHLRGRLMSVFAMIFLGMAPFGALIAGLIAKPLGAPLTVTIGGVCCALSAIVFLRRLPEIREGTRSMIADRQRELAAHELN